VTVQLLGKDDSSFEDSEVLTGRWQAYVESFVSDEHTQGIVKASSIRRPFLRRTISPSASTDQVPDIIARGGLEIKVCVRTYRLFFVSHSEDYLWRKPDKDASEATRKRVQVKMDKRKGWLEEYVGKLDQDRGVPRDPPEITPTSHPPPAVENPNVREDASRTDPARTQQVAPPGVLETPRG